MQHVLSSKELCMHLNDFRKTLQEFDYSHIENVRFLNLESVYAYMENVENNPFRNQFQELQARLDTLQPYLPFLSSQRAKEFLIQIAQVTNDEEVEKIKLEYLKKLRLDFINTSRKITCQEDWNLIVQTCEQIRSRKEEALILNMEQ